MRKKINGKKILTLFLALAIIFTSIPLGYLTGSVSTADAAASGQLSKILANNFDDISLIYFILRLICNLIQVNT